MYSNVLVRVAKSKAKGTLTNEANMLAAKRMNESIY